MKNYIATGNPGKSGVYMVDRDTIQVGQGQAFRYFNMETGKWGITAYEPQEAYALREHESALPFLPFVGTPVKVNTKSEEVKMMAEPVLKVTKVGNQKVGLVQSKPTKAAKAADARILKAVTKPKATKVTHPDGTVFYREDRKKWVVVIDGKQPAARPTKEGVVKWLASKHPNVKPTILE
jgi:hypothetical protein